MHKSLLLFIGLSVLFAIVTTNPSDSSLPLIQWLNLVIRAIGVNVFDGNANTNGGPLISNNLSQPPMANAEYYMHFQAAASCSFIEDWTCPFCLYLSEQAKISFVRVIEDPTYNTFAYIALDHTNCSIIVVIRGTSNVQNIVEDLDFVFISPWSTNSSILVHKGFYAAMMSLYYEIVSTVNEQLIINPTYRIVILGHSLGGAEAALLTFKLQIEDTYSGVNMEIYTYGEPRNGNKEYVNSFNALKISSARVVEGSDLVPHFYPAIAGFYHRQNELWIYDTVANAARYCDTTLYEDPTCSNSQGPLYNPVDHIIYYGLDITECVVLEPFGFVLQLLNPLGAFVPSWIIRLFPVSTGYYNPFLNLFQIVLG